MEQSDMKPSEVKSRLKLAIMDNWCPFMIVGRPGVGKTMLIEQVCRELNTDNIPTAFLVRHPSVESPPDILGLPSVHGGRAKFLPYGYQEFMCNPPKYLKHVVVLIDDAGQASEIMQKAYMQILSARRLNDQVIDNRVVFVLATNRKQDKAGISPVLSTVINRIKMIIEMHPDAKEWCIWASQTKLPNGNPYPPELIVFNRFKPNWIEEEPVINRGEFKAFPTPRSISFLAEIWDQGIRGTEEVSGVVGEAYATDFLAFYRNYDALSHIPDAVFNNPKNAPIPKEMSQKYAVCGALAARANVENIENIMIYAKRLEKEDHGPELSLMLVKMCVDYHPEVGMTDAFINWSASSQNILI